MALVELRSTLPELRNVQIVALTGKKASKKETFLETEFESGAKLFFDLANKGEVFFVKTGKKTRIYKGEKELNLYLNLILEAFDGDKKYFVRYDEI